MRCLQLQADDNDDTDKNKCLLYLSHKCSPFNTQQYSPCTQTPQKEKKKKGKKKNKVIRIWDYVSLAYLNKMFTLER